MDLRIVKTQKAIKESFLALRKDLPLSKIKVKAICDMALINKSTFYKYYADVYDLSDQIEDEFIENVLALNGTDLMFTNPELFINSMQEIIKAHIEEMDILFRDRQHIFHAKANRQLSEHLHSTEQENIIPAAMFVLGGLAFSNFAISDHGKDENAELKKDLVSYITAIGNTL